MRPHELEVAIDLAGESAACRALRGASSEWHRPPTERQMTAHHEAGHLVVAEALGRFAIWGVITPEGGRAYSTETLEEGADIQPDYGPGGRSDGDKIGCYCEVMADDDEARESLRESLRAQVDAIVEKYWPAIEKVADILDREGVILRPEILRICAAYPPTA